ncbi:hypothetical protein C2I36_09890 [Rhodobacteraceae bacterium WD3A24]|nr:hypothetical protein C2I36_09890 [Rhodobacteraceae bacterium WD3A24]
MTAFSAAIDAIFADPNMAVDAIWKAGGSGSGVSLRAVRRSPDQIATFGESRFVSDTTTLDIRVSEAPTLAESDTLEVGSETFLVIGEPMQDSDRLVWTVEARPQ